MQSPTDPLKAFDHVGWLSVKSLYAPVIMLLVTYFHVQETET